MRLVGLLVIMPMLAFPAQAEVDPIGGTVCPVI